MTEAVGHSQVHTKGALTFHTFPKQSVNLFAALAVLLTASKHREQSQDPERTGSVRDPTTQLNLNLLKYMTFSEDFFLFPRTGREVPFSDGHAPMYLLIIHFNYFFFGLGSPPFPKMRLCKIYNNNNNNNLQ